MTSNDKQQFVTVDIFNDAINKINVRFDNIDKTMNEIHYELRYNARDTEHLQTSVYWGFAIIAAVIALVGFVITLAPMFRDMYRDAKQARSQDNIRKLVREVMQDEIDAAVQRALKTK